MLFKCFFLFLVLMAVLFSGVDPQWQFGRGSSKKHFCEILLKSAYWPWSRCCFKSFSIFSFDSHFVQRSGTILAILVKGQTRNIPVKLFWNLPIGLGGDVV